MAVLQEVHKPVSTERIKAFQKIYDFRGSSQDNASRISEDVTLALKYKSEFFSALGIPLEEQPKTPFLYEPWLARAQFERVFFVPPDKRAYVVDAFQEGEARQITTTLRERYNTEKSTIRYLTSDGKLYSELLPKEPFESVLLRGLEYRQRTRSKELIRETKEIEGFRQVQKIICDRTTPLGTKIILCSPPGLVSDTAYPKRFVDIWELKEDRNGDRYAEMTRFTTSLNYEGYKKSARRFNPSYFDSEEVKTMSLDAWFASHPSVLYSDPYYQERQSTIQDLYEEFFEPDYTVMKEQQFQELLHVCMPFIHYYIGELTKELVDWAELAIAFNAILNKADAILEKREKENGMSHHVQVFDVNVSPRIVREEMLYWGTQVVRATTGGCGPSVGFKIRYGFENATEALLNSVGKFGLERTNYKDDPNLCRCGGQEPHFHCPGTKGDGSCCNHPIIVGQGITQCPSCGAGKVC